MRLGIPSNPASSSEAESESESPLASDANLKLKPQPASLSASASASELSEELQVKRLHCSNPIYSKQVLDAIRR